MENPTILSNLIELYSMMLLPGACVITFGRWWAMAAAHIRRAKSRNMPCLHTGKG